jgi:peptidoglycan/LPS O-acetylase OafA/YrhL
VASAGPTDPITSVSLEQSDTLIARLPFVEGIRGYAALTVVLGHFAHASHRLMTHASFFHVAWRERLVWLAWPGTEMVYLFLMISGFSLFYSEDVRRLKAPATSIGLFARRRAWRILPTYYVAFAFGVLMLTIVPAHYIRPVPVLTAEPLTLGGVLSHLALVHNLERAWIYQGDGPLWSMAYEAQLYLLFPLLYWACKRYPATLVCGFAIVVDLLLNHGRSAEESLPFGLLRWFALGILAASIYREPWLRRIPTRLLVAVGVALLLVAYLRFAAVGDGVKHDLVWGAAYLLLVLAMTRTPEARANPMNARPVRWLGLRSYSLYAFHFPIVWAVFAALAAAGTGTHSLREILLFAIGVPLSIAVAQLAFKLVEQPSLRHIRTLR